jgi:hypothetical protein
MNYKPLEIDKGRWYQFSLAEQLGNIGSEVDRYVNLQSMDKNYSMHALYRAIDLIDITKSDPRWKGARRKEINRIKELLCDATLGDNEYRTPIKYFQDYFLDFAIVARTRAGK